MDYISNNKGCCITCKYFGYDEEYKQVCKTALDYTKTTHDTVKCVKYHSKFVPKGRKGNKLTIFLDIDGVLNAYPRKSNADILKEYIGMTEYFEHKYGTDWMRPDCLISFRKALDILVDKHGLQIDLVLSSAWRTIYTIDQLNKIFEHFLGNHRLTDTTGQGPSGRTPYLRGLQIRRYIKYKRIPRYVILDDEISHIFQLDRTYLTDMETGFEEKDINTFVDLCLYWTKRKFIY
ncbi:MAG: HAD domain-containing protein [Paraclostridium sp.]